METQDQIVPTDAIKVFESQEALEKFIKGEAEPGVKEPKEPPAEPAPAATKTEPDSGAGQPQEQAKPAEPESVPAGVQKRIDKAVAQQRDAERRAEAAERELAALRQPKPAAQAQPAEAPKRPNPDDFKTQAEYDTAEAKYQEDLIDYRATLLMEKREKQRAEDARKAEEQQRAAELDRSWNERLAASIEVHPDYETVVTDAIVSLIPPGSPLDLAILHRPKGAEVLYLLAANGFFNPESIAKMTHGDAMFEYFKAEASLGTTASNVTPVPEPPKRPLSAASEPIEPIKPSAGAGEPPMLIHGNKLNPAWQEWRDKRRRT